jgi:serine phosphatase RsbU (regulator of sigma subunit)
LEKNVEQNQEAIKKAEEKTRMLLSRLRMMVLQKDSVRYINEKNLAKMKKEKEDAEKKLYLNIVISAVVIAFLTALTLFFYNLNNKIKKQKAEMAEINKELENTQKDLLTTISEVKKQRVENENKSKEIQENIAAAHVIQKSIMPPDSYLNQYFKDYFVMYNPKESVSGDFYWFNAKDDYLYLAVCDCTGHGVSGALTSMIGFHALNHAINAVKNPTPSETLELLNKEFLDAISNNKAFNDSIVSMDVSLCRINTRYGQLEYAGAKNQLFILRGEELIVIKGEKMSIGMSRGSSDAKFTDHKVDIKPGDKFYIFSDGFADQMGGPDGVTKFMYSSLKEKLVAISGKSFSQQRDELVQTFVEWKGRNEQTDDLLVIGFKG